VAEKGCSVFTAIVGSVGVTEIDTSWALLLVPLIGALTFPTPQPDIIAKRSDSDRIDTIFLFTMFTYPPC
jgi:hypothetical protein